MDVSGIALCIVSAFGFSAWPIIIKYTGVKGPWAAIMILVPAAVLSLILSARGGIEWPDSRVMAFLVLAGILDSTALVCYITMLDGKHSASGLMTANVILMTLFTALGGFIVMGEPVTKEKAAGLVLGLIAAALLMK